MPYTEQVDRNKLDLLINQTAKRIETKGDLNYTICELVAQLILNSGPSYTTISNWIDGVHGAERELTRRILNYYEDQKIAENGDVKSFEKILKLLEV
jgi:hypothetical protein